MQTLPLVTLNANGPLWARYIIHDPVADDRQTSLPAAIAVLRYTIRHLQSSSH
jgi:hypothetical protein